MPKRNQVCRYVVSMVNNNYYYYHFPCIVDLKFPQIDLVDEKLEKILTLGFHFFLISRFCSLIIFDQEPQEVSIFGMKPKDAAEFKAQTIVVKNQERTWDIYI